MLGNLRRIARLTPANGRARLAAAFGSLPRHEKLTMPALSPTMKQGKITKWNYKVGDKIEAGDVLAEIETDKSSVGFEMQEDGYIAKILVEESSSVDVGKAVVILVPKKSDVASFANYSDEDGSGETSGNAVDQSQASEQEEKPAKKSGQSKKKPTKAQGSSGTGKSAKASLPAHEVLRMPSLSPTMKDGKILKWNYAVGDKVVAGDCIAEIQTDKSTVGFDIQEDGYVAAILANEGEGAIEVNQPIVVLTTKKDSVAAFQNYSPGDDAGEEVEEDVEEDFEDEEEVETVVRSKPQTKAQASSNDGCRIIASPFAKAIARENKVDLSTVTGSGDRGRITADDVLKAKSQPKPVEKKQPQKTQTQTATQPSSGSYQEIPLSQMRKVIGQRLTESKQNLPHYYVTMEIKMDKLLSFRRQVNEDMKEKLSVNDFIIKAASIACKIVPEVNSQWHGDVIRRFEDVDVSFAVAIESGLITPIVASADSKSLSQISRDTKDLIARAKEGKLKPEEYLGGTFTISNLGMFGVKQFTAIINPPQACILAVGGTEMHPVYSETAENKIEFVNKMLVTLSSDHRVVDGAIAAKWLNVFRDMLESPMKMLI